MARRLRSAALVGRAGELALLEEAAGRAASGCGSLVVVRGEPGVGKSRLLAETVARSAAAGRPALVGRAIEGGGAFRPLADALLRRHRGDGLPPPADLEPFARAVAGLVPGWGPQPAGAPYADQSLHLSEALVRLLRMLGRHRGALLALDDLHWSDADTLVVLDRLADAVQDLPTVLLLAARADGPSMLERLEARAGATARLGRLSAAETGELVDACAGAPLPGHVRDHLVDFSEGLPFLAEELLADLVEAGTLRATAQGWSAAAVTTTVPGSVATPAARRLSALDPEARAVVEAAAVLGRQVDWRLLPALAGLTEAEVLMALRTAVEQDLLLAGESGELRFRHALVREAVLEWLLPPQKAALARRAARLVEQRGEDLVLAAALYEQGDEPVRAGRLLAAAAVQAGGALGTRERLLRRAVELVPDDDDLVLALVEVLAAAGRAVEARELGAPLLARLEVSDTRRGSAAMTLTRACLAAGRPQEAELFLRSVSDGPGAAALAANVAFAQHRPDEADRLARSAVGAADPAVRCEAFELVGRVARLRDRREEAEEAFGQILSLADEHALPLWRVRAQHELGTLDLLGPARTERLQAARELAVRTGVLGTAAVLDLQIAAVHGLRMEHDATTAAARRCVELAQALGLSSLAGTALIFVGSAQAHAGDVLGMHATLDRAAACLRDDPEHLAAVGLARAIPLMVEPDLDAWARALREGVQVLRRNPAAAPSPYRGLHVLVETVLGDGAADREEMRHSGATVQACNRAALAYADAVADGRAGRDATEHLRVAERFMEPLVWRRHHARLLVASSALRDGWGEPLDWLREGLSAFTALGVDGLARACRTQLRDAGVVVPRWARSAHVAPPHLARLGVTSREAEVLVMVADGLSNAMIAERLYLSPRTVESHVAALLRKTSTGRRSDLAALRAGAVSVRESS